MSLPSESITSSAHVARLNEVAEVVRGVTFNKSQSTNEPSTDRIPVLRAGNISGSLDLSNNLIWIPRSLVSDKQLLKKNDIVMCMSSGSSKIVGKSAILDHDWDGTFGAFLAVIRTYTAKCLPEYIAYFLQSDGFRKWTESSSGANIKNIRKSELESFQIPIPPLAEQRRIVDILNRADSIRRLRKQAINTARQLIPALFIDMFGDPATNPREWPRQNLGDLVVLRSGGTPSKKQAGYWGGNIPWISPKDMKTDVITDSIDHVTEKALLETSLKEIPPESVLIVVRGMILAHTVPIALTLAKVTINQDMKAMTPCDLISPIYLKWTLQSMHSHLLSKVTTSAHGTRKLDTNRVLETPIPTPPMELQSDFTSKAKDIHSIIAQHKAALHKSEQIFQSILDDVFGGLRQAANAQPGL